MKTKIFTYTGDGLDNKSVTTGLGSVQVDLVFIFASGRNAVFSISDWAADNTKEAEGSAIFAGGVKALNADGTITLGTDTRVNAAAIVYFGLAIHDNGIPDYTVIPYVGNGADNRSITGALFAPNFAVVLPFDNTNPPWFKSSAGHGSGESQTFGNVVAADRIQELEATGVQLGTTIVNTNLAQYYLVLMKVSAIPLGVFNIVAYSGDSVDNRSITGVGFQPDLAIVPCTNAVTDALCRSMDQVGDTSLNMIGGGGVNRIQALEADGIQVGTNATSNLSGRNYILLAFQDGETLSDVSLRRTRVGVGL